MSLCALFYYDNVRLVEYQRDRHPGGYTTLPDHMPPQHRIHADETEATQSQSRSQEG